MTHSVPPTLLIGVVLTLAGCATPPRVGVRAGFEDRVVPGVSISPIWSTSRFGNSPSEWRALEQITVHVLVEELESIGFTVVDPEGLRDDLERKRAWDRFEQILDEDDGLDQRFEPSLYTPATAEVLTLRELSDEGAVETEAVLFAEIVYHSEGECTVDPRQHSRFAQVVNRDGDPIEPQSSSPCVVTHLQAKLVDTKSASTMWHNRVLREMRVSELQPSDGPANVRRTAQILVTGAHGLAPFAPTRSAVVRK